jgi:hypothetical protein
MYVNWKCVIKCGVFTVGFGNSLPRFKRLFQIVLVLICVCIHTYFQAKLNSKSSDVTIHMSDPDSKSSSILSDGSLTDILRPDFNYLSFIFTAY